MFKKLFKQTFKKTWSECFILYKGGIMELLVPVWSWFKKIPAMVVKVMFLLINLTLGAALMLAIAPFFITLKRIFF